MKALANRQGRYSACSRAPKKPKPPGDDPTNGLYESLPPPAARVADGQIAIDFAVIRAGTCRNAVAQRLGGLRPDKRVALVEATRVGCGTSGRNDGFMRDHHSHGSMHHLEAVKNKNHLMTACTAYLRKSVQQY